MNKYVLLCKGIKVNFLPNTANSVPDILLPSSLLTEPQLGSGRHCAQLKMLPSQLGVTARVWHSSGRYDVSWRFLGKFCFPNTVIPFPFPPFSFLSRMQRRGWRWSNHPRMLRRAGAPKSQAKDSQVQGHIGPGVLMTRKQPDRGPLHGSVYEHNIPYLVKPLMLESIP